MVRNGKCRDAIAHARRHLAPMATKEPLHMETLQKAMGTLAYSGSSMPPAYQEMFQDERWEELINQFQQENNRVHLLPPCSLLSICTQAGLSSFKTQFCYGPKEYRSKECPVCVDTIGKLAGPLPSSLRTNSCVRCLITSEPFDGEDYAPLVLPNGRIYSKKALEQMALEGNGLVKDPATGQTFPFEQTKKAFIVLEGCN